MPGKSKTHYLRLLDMLPRRCPELARLLFIIDFELAMIVAIQEKFPEASIGGCFFHFCHNVKKHADEKLKQKRQTIIHFRRRVFRLTSLAFLPPKVILPAWLKLKSTLCAHVQGYRARKLTSRNYRGSSQPPPVQERCAAHSVLKAMRAHSPTEFRGSLQV